MSADDSVPALAAITKLCGGGRQRNMGRSSFTVGLVDLGWSVALSVTGMASPLWRRLIFSREEIYNTGLNSV